jgi:hypothetical protein
MNTPLGTDELNVTRPRSLTRRSVLKMGLALTGSAVFGASLAACVTERDDADAPAAEAADDSADEEIASDPGDDDGTDEVSEHSKDDDDERYDRAAVEAEYEQFVEDWYEEYEMFELPELDLASSEVEIQGQTYDVWAYQNTWVGEVTDDLFIAFSIEEGYSEGAGEISAYACDNGEASVYLTGELQDGEADLDDCVDKIVLSLDGDEITGTLTLEDQEPLTFVAIPAEGDAGLYRTETIEMGELEVVTRWVVLEDGRRRGGRKCRNPWTGDCMWCPVPK